MSDKNEEFWGEVPSPGNDPKGGGNRPPLEPGEICWLAAKVVAISTIEAMNWLLHTANISLVNDIASNVYVTDIIYVLSGFESLQNLTINHLLNSLFGLAAVATPVVIFGFILDKPDICSNPRKFFSDGRNAVIGILILSLFLVLLGTEFVALYLRVLEDTSPDPLFAFNDEPTGFWPLLIICCASIFVNLGLSLAAANVLRAVKKTLEV